MKFYYFYNENITKAFQKKTSQKNKSSDTESYL